MVVAAVAEENNNMPTIQIPNFQPVNAAVGGRALDAQAAAAPWGAVAQAGAAIADSGALLARYRQNQQNHVNAGILANEDTIRRNTFSEIQEYAAQNQSSPEAWDKFAQEKWTTYKEGRTSRAQQNGWDKNVMRVDSVESDTYMARANIMFGAERSKALVRQANGRLEVQAETFVRSGDTKQAAAIVDSMNLAPEEKAIRKAQVFNNGFYYTAQTSLSAMRDLPPAKQRVAVDAFVADLSAKGEDGRFKQFETDEGGLTLAARRQLIDAAFARAHAASVDMNQNVKSVAQKVKLGAPIDETVQSALSAGLIDETTARAYSPDIMEAADIYAEKQKTKKDIKDAKDQAALDAQLSRQDRALTSTLLGIQKKTPAITEKDIDNAEAVGITRRSDIRGLSRAGAEQARQELRARAATELADPTGAYALITAKMDELKGSSFMGFLPGVEYDRAQQPAEKQTAMLNLIAAANLTTNNRLKLMEKFFEVRQADLKDNEINSKAGDRELTTEETELRQGVTQQFRTLAKEFRSAQTVGQLYFKQSEEIEEWFTKNEGASPQIRQQQAKAFMQKYAKEISEAAAGSQLQEVIQ